MDEQPTTFNSQPVGGQSVPKKSKKLGLLLTLLAVAIAAAAAFGIYYWQQQNVDSLNSQLSSQNTKVASLQKQVASLKKQVSSSKNSTSASADNSATTVIKIPELSLEITVPNSIKDITYKVNPASALSTGQQTQSVTLSTQALTKLDPSCVAALGTISRTTGQYPQSPDVLQNNASGALIKQYMTFYTGFTSPQAACSGNNATSMSALDDLNLFKKAFSTIEPI